MNSLQISLDETRGLRQPCSSFAKLLTAFVLILAGIAAADAQSYYWQSFVGMPGGIGSADGTGTNARFYSPQGLAVDASGNVYVADTSNHTVRKIMAGGSVTTVAGAPGFSGAVDAFSGSSARFNHPFGVSVDPTGVVYVADANNNTIRKIARNGLTTTIAGAPGATGTTDASGYDARFSAPYGVAADSSGNVFVADYLNHTIRKVASDGTVTTLAGTPGVSGTADGAGTVAQFNGPSSLALDASGNLYVTDCNNSTIRKVTSSGTVTTVAGVPMSAGSADGPAATAKFNFPTGIAVDANGVVYVADTSNRTIRKLTTDGTVTTLAGSAGASGVVDATGSNARFSWPIGAAVDAGGNVYVADANMIRMIAASGAVTTVAGDMSFVGSSDGSGTGARFYSPKGVTVDGSGNVYVADYANNLIRKATPAGIVTTVAGSYASGTSNGTGSLARFSYPQSVAVDGSNNLFVADTYNHTVRAIAPGGAVTTLAGVPGAFGYANGPAGSALFFRPGGVTVDALGHLFLADTYNSVIRTIAGGTVTTLAGTPDVSGTVNGTGTSAQFNYPGAVAVDRNDNVYVADSSNYAIRVILSSGVVGIKAGTPGLSGTADGTGTGARFTYPQGLAVDASGNVYVADNLSHTIRKITSFGVVTTIGGQPGTASAADGIGSAALFSYPSAVAVDTQGNLYVADSSNNRIAKGMPLTAGAVPAAIQGTPTSTVFNGTTLTGTVYSNSLATTVYFKYGTTTGYGFTSGTQTIASGTGPISVALPVTGLNPTTSYHFQIVAVNSSGSSVGLDQTFATSAPPLPSVTTGQATAVDYQSGTITATVNPNGLATMVRFNYGTTQLYSQVTGTQSIGSGTTAVSIAVPITNLNPGTTYHFQAVATNAGGLNSGLDQAFTTLQPSIAAEAVAVTGDPAAGIPNAWLTGFRGSSIDSNEAAGYWASFNGGAALCVDSGSEVSIVAQTGAQAPGASSTFSGFGDTEFSNLNLLAFVGTLNTGGAVTSANDTGVWLDANGAVNLIARAGMQAPGCPSGTKFASFSRLVLPNSGGLVFLAKLVHHGSSVTTANDTAIWGINSTGHLKLLIRKGTSAKVGSTSKRVTSLSAFSATSPASGNRGFNSAGTIVAVAGFSGGSQSVVKIARAGTVSAAVTSGASVPGVAGAVYRSFTNPTIDNANHVAFKARIAGGSIGTSNNSGIWVVPSSTRAPIARTGSVAPGVSGRVQFKTLGDPVINNQGKVAFAATLATKAVGIWANTSGKLWPVARTQTQAPGCPSGAVFSTFQRFALPDQSGPVILASLAVGPGGVSAWNNVGIWKADSNGALSLIARTGDSVEIEGLVKFIAGLEIFNSTGDANAQPGGSNARGDLIFLATFSDGTQALITAAVRS